MSPSPLTTFAAALTVASMAVCVSASPYYRTELYIPLPDPSHTTDWMTADPEPTESPARGRRSPQLGLGSLTSLATNAFASAMPGGLGAMASLIPDEITSKLPGDPAAALNKLPEALSGQLGGDAAADLAKLPEAMIEKLPDSVSEKLAEDDPEAALTALADEVVASLPGDPADLIDLLPDSVGSQLPDDPDAAAAKLAKDTVAAAISAASEASSRRRRRDAAPSDPSGDSCVMPDPPADPSTMIMEKLPLTPANASDDAAASSRRRRDATTDGLMSNLPIDPSKIMEKLPLDPSKVMEKLPLDPSSLAAMPVKAFSDGLAAFGGIGKSVTDTFSNIFRSRRSSPPPQQPEPRDPLCAMGGCDPVVDPTFPVGQQQQQQQQQQRPKRSYDADTEFYSDYDDSDDESIEYRPRYRRPISRRRYDYDDDDDGSVDRTVRRRNHRRRMRPATKAPSSSRRSYFDSDNEYDRDGVYEAHLAAAAAKTSADKPCERKCEPTVEFVPLYSTLPLRGEMIYDGTKE